MDSSHQSRHNLDTDGLSSDNDKAAGFSIGKGQSNFSVDSLHFQDDEQLDKDF